MRGEKGLAVRLKLMIVFMTALICKSFLINDLIFKMCQSRFVKWDETLVTEVISLTQKD